MARKILIIEDDKEINSLLSNILTNNGYETVSSLSGQDGLDKAKSEIFDMILLDLMLPFKSGDEVLRQIRMFSEVPVLIISAKDLTYVKVDLLKLGADDYITKPFDIDEVIARIETNLRRYSKQRDIKTYDNILKYADISLNTETKEVYVNNNLLNLTSKEYQIMELFLIYPNKVFSKANLYKTVWNEEYWGEENTLNVHISNLRNKLKVLSPNREYIETLWGMGYRLYKNI